MASKFVRRTQSLLSKCIFWARRRFHEPTLDPRRDSVLLPASTYSPWLLDPRFLEAQELIDRHTLVDRFRRWELWHLIAQVRDLPGDLLEVGVWRGGTGVLMALRCRDLGLPAAVHLCDTFQGVVKAGAEDPHYAEGEHADTSIETVQSLLARFGLENCAIHVGIFPEQTGGRLADRSFRLTHIDVDVYESARDIFEWVWPRTPDGGVVVFDDYGFSTTRGVTKLCDELGERADVRMVHNLNGHAVLFKVPTN